MDNKSDDEFKKKHIKQIKVFRRTILAFIGVWIVAVVITFLFASKYFVD